MATLDLFQDHSTEQAAARGGNCGVAERATLVRVNAAEGPAGAGYQESAPQVPPGVCPADDPNPEALEIGGPSPSSSGACAAHRPKGERGDALSVSDDAHGTGTPAAQTCGSCGNSSPHKFGFLKCDYLPAWRWMAAHAACAFPVSQWVVIDAASLAKRDAQRGIDQAADAQEQRSHGWSDRAFDFIKEFCEQNKGREFIGAEIVSASLQTNLPRPDNLKAWGRPLQRAARAGVIVKAGYAPDPARHGNPVPLWKAA